MLFEVIVKETSTSKQQINRNRFKENIEKFDLQQCENKISDSLKACFQGSLGLYFRYFSPELTEPAQKNRKMEFFA